MTLDVVLPTFNRAELLPRTLDSLEVARCPDGLDIHLYVVDNNSTDGTRAVVDKYAARFPYPVHYVFERLQGSSAALNAGIRAGTGDLIGMLNDDERIDPGWFSVIQDFFEDERYSFAGGPYYPDWAAEKPAWISKETGGIVGWVDGGETRKEYGPDFAGMLMGGNAVVRRTVFVAVGLYETTLGRFDKGLTSCEDELMFRRILAGGFKGMYLPELIIHHYIPASRMTRRYHRDWSWGQGISLARLAEIREPDVALLFGVPRWQFRHAAHGIVHAVKGRLGLESPEGAFEGELRAWALAGYIYRRWFKKPSR